MSAGVAPQAPVDGAEIWQLKVALSHTKPPIWRRLEVPGDLTLETLHRVVQEAFGWCDSHMHVFETRGGRFGVPDRELGFRDERALTVSEVAPRRGDKLSYTYDFGDNWEHTIAVEKLVARTSGTHYPRCTGGRRACPPEDCGGVSAYEEVLHAVGDPGHEPQEEMASWLQEMIAGGFDPAKFDVSETNERLVQTV